MAKKKFDVIFYGMVIVDHLFIFEKFPERFAITSAKKKFKKLGGSATNSATCISNWNVNTALLGCHLLGADIDGDFFLQDLQKYKINTKQIEQNRSGTTHNAYILVDEIGERTILADPAPEKYLSISTDFLSQTRLLCLDGYFAKSATFMQEAAEKAHKLKIPIMLSDTYPSEPHFRLASIVLVSQQIKQSELSELPKKLLQMYEDYSEIIVIVTLGVLGCMVVHQNECKYFSLPYGGNIIDTTGAGDNFRAGITYGYLQEWNIEKMVAFGMYVGTKACEFYGGSVPQDIPSETWVDLFEKSYQT